jgi:hypothetical protein
MDEKSVLVEEKVSANKFAWLMAFLFSIYLLGVLPYIAYETVIKKPMDFRDVIGAWCCLILIPIGFAFNPLVWLFFSRVWPRMSKVAQFHLTRVGVFIYSMILGLGIPAAILTVPRNDFFNSSKFFDGLALWCQQRCDDPGVSSEARHWR